MRRRTANELWRVSRNRQAAVARHLRQEVSMRREPSDMCSCRIDTPQLATIAAVAFAGAIAARSAQAQDAQRGAAAEAGIHKIKHIVIIMQENRSFDHYFGTYPGADGLPTKDGAFTVCIPDPGKGACA